MCTIIKRFINRPVFAWKTVLTNNYLTVSPYQMQYYWKVGANIAKLHPPVFSGLDSPVFSEDLFPRDYDIFHCFARRSDARKHKKHFQTTYPHVTSKYSANSYSVKIIKVKVTGKVFKGEVNGINIDFNGLPAICGTECEWDGTFHR